MVTKKILQMNVISVYKIAQILIAHLVFVDYICSWYLRFGCQGLFPVLKVWVPRFVLGTEVLGA